MSTTAAAKLLACEGCGTPTADRLHNDDGDWACCPACAPSSASASSVPAIRRIELPADLAAERYTFRAVLARLQAAGAPMTHSAHITDGALCILRCSAARAAAYAEALRA